MNRMIQKKADKRIRIENFGCATSLLFTERRLSTEIALAPLEVSRILSGWLEVELAKKTPDERIVAALELLASKARTKAPGFVAEVPIASTGRVLLIPDN